MTLLQTAVTRLIVAAVLSSSATPFSVKVLRIGWLLFEINMVCKQITNAVSAYETAV